MLGDKSVCQVVGIGSISLRMHDGVTRILKNVRHIPILKRNLISLGMFEKEGYKFMAENSQLTVIKGGTTVLKGSKKRDLYYLLRNT